MVFYSRNAWIAKSLGHPQLPDGVTLDWTGDLIYILRTIMAINHVRTFVVEIFPPLDQLLEEVLQGLGEQRLFSVEVKEFVYVPGAPDF